MLKKITIRGLDSELYRTAKIEAARRGITVYALLNEIIKKYLERIK